MKPWSLVALVLPALSAACVGDPVNGKYTLKSARASVDSMGHVVVDAAALNDGSDVWAGGGRCVKVSWEASPGVSAAEASAAARAAAADGGLEDDSTLVAVIETQRQCVESNKNLSAGDGDSFHFVAQHSRQDLLGTVIVTVIGWDPNVQRILQPSP